METKEWEICFYEATNRFRNITMHTGVCRSDNGTIIAITGPAGDRESMEHAALIAAAPALLEALEQLVVYCDGMGKGSARPCEVARGAIYKAQRMPAIVTAEEPDEAIIMRRTERLIDVLEASLRQIRAALSRDEEEHND